jgi:hypothetical protein
VAASPIRNVFGTGGTRVTDAATLSAVASSLSASRSHDVPATATTAMNRSTTR